jgi:hypothetical protein
MLSKTAELVITLRQLLGENSRYYISDSRLEMMVQMSGGLLQDSFKIAVGYILQTLDLQLHNGAEHGDELRREMAYYQGLLNNKVVHLAA